MRSLILSLNLLRRLLQKPTHHGRTQDSSVLLPFDAKGKDDHAVWHVGRPAKSLEMITAVEYSLRQTESGRRNRPSERDQKRYRGDRRVTEDSQLDIRSELLHELFDEQSQSQTAKTGDQGNRRGSGMGREERGIL